MGFEEIWDGGATGNQPNSANQKIIQKSRRGKFLPKSIPEKGKVDLKGKLFKKKAEEKPEKKKSTFRERMSLGCK